MQKHTGWQHLLHSKNGTLKNGEERVMLFKKKRCLASTDIITTGFNPLTKTRKDNESRRLDPSKITTEKMANINGIPQKVLDKIFQPFFTTKPTGQGTGLGLSLSYDIIKAHGGEIKVETKEGEGSTFIIELPYEICAIRKSF